MFSPQRVMNPPGSAALTPPSGGRAIAVPVLLSPMKQATPPRGAMQLLRAGAATYQHEFEVYRAECHFHNLHFERTVRIMQDISKTFKQEWDLYLAEAGAQGAAAEVAANAAMADDTPSIFDNIFDDGMRPGGYHPAQPGEQFKNGRYTALYKLGQGHYATVWMVKDVATGQQAAMKIVRSAPEYTEAARNEIKMLKAIRDNDPTGAKHCVRLLDSFDHTGPHGTHMCEVFEAMGDDLLTLIRVFNFRGVPLNIVRHLVRQTLVALDYLHAKCNIIHTDLKPENVMLTEPIRNRRGQPFGKKNEVERAELERRLMGMGCKIVDFGCACPTQEQIQDYVQTRQYRAPEVILGSGYDDSADMWSLACMVFELVTGDLLFFPEAKAGEWSQDEDHLAQMMELLHPMPAEVATAGKYSHEFFRSDGSMRSAARRLKAQPLDRLLADKYGLPAHEVSALCDFLLPMLEFDPAKRASAADMLAHPWLHIDLAAQPRPAAGSSSRPGYVPRVQFGQGAVLA